MSEYRNEADMKTKREMLSQDRAANTYLEQASATIGQELGGRFAHLARGQQQVVGSAPSPYPKMPANSPWSCDPVPREEPLGVDINALEPIGGPAETVPVPEVETVLAMTCSVITTEVEPTKPQVSKTFRRRI
jgi:hypothetical protein